MAPSVVDWALAGEIVNIIPQRTRNTARMKNLPTFTEILHEDDYRNTPTLAALRTAVCGDRNARGIRGHPTPYLAPPPRRSYVRACYYHMNARRAIQKKRRPEDAWRICGGDLRHRNKRVTVLPRDAGATGDFTKGLESMGVMDGIRDGRAA